MKLVTKKITEIIPYENNPRINDQAVDAVAESIKQCGYVQRIVVDESGVILAGHTRFKALQQLGYDEIEVAIAEGLTEEQKKKYRLLDNKTNELAAWNFEKLDEELANLDFVVFGWGDLRQLHFYSDCFCRPNACQNTCDYGNYANMSQGRV